MRIGLVQAGREGKSQVVDRGTASVCVVENGKSYHYQPGKGCMV